MTYPWFKLWNELLDDPKFAAAAELAGSTVPVAVCSFLKLCSHANQQPNREEGSFAGLHPQVIAATCRVAVEEISRLLAAFRELGMVAGECLVNWAKRQFERFVGERRSAPIAAPPKRRTSAAIRQQRRRDKLKQPSLFDFANGVTGRDAGRDVTPESVTFGRDVTVEEKRDSDSESLRESEPLPAAEEGVNDSEGVFFGRFAPLEKPPSTTVVPIDRLKELKAQRWRNRVERFVQAAYTGDEQERRMLGLMGADPIVDAKRWYEVCDKERIAARWDDVRDRRKPAREVA